MRDFLTYVRLTLRIMLRDDLWLVVIPVLIVLAVGAWVLASTPPGQWHPMSALTQAEVFGPFIAAFLFAGLLEPEHRRGVGEIVLSKPHPPAVLLGVRMGLALLGTLGLLLALLLAYHFRFGDAMVLKSLAYAVPPCLFIGSVAVTAAHSSRSATTGYAVPLVFWLWDTSGGLAYNPLFILPAGALGAAEQQGGPMPVSVAATKIAMLVTAAFLFWINVRRLRRGEASGTGMRQRVKLVAAGALVLFGYFWTGAVAKLWLLTAHPAGPPFLESSNFAARRGQSLIGANAGFRVLMAVYGPVPLAPLLGPGAASFLTGLGVGLDPAEASTDARRRQALEANLRQRVLNPWRSRARLALAGMDASSAAAAPAAEGTGADHPAPAWITVGLVDPDRWWVMRQPAGPNPARAEQRCAEALAHTPSAATALQALSLRAALAADRWDFRSEANDLREVALEHPDSPLAEQALSLASQASGWPPGAILPLYRHVLQHQAAAERVRLALGYASMQAQNGEVAAARATLRDALSQAERVGKSGAGRAPVADRNVHNELTRLLRSLDGKEDTPAPPSPPPPAGPLIPVRSRIRAAGKPLAGIAAALVPLAEAFRCLPYPASADAASPRAAAAYPPPARRSFYQFGLALTPWNPEALAFALRWQPTLLARSDARGELHWPGVPAGAYALFLRFGTWQLPENGRHLAPVPTRVPVVVSGAATVVPEIQLLPPLRLTSRASRTGVQAVHWPPVPGAASYRVALRDTTDAIQGMGLVAATGSGAPGIDPSLVWWQDGITGTSAQMSPAGFVGPAADLLRSGLEPGRQYAWYVEALGRDGGVLATSETLAAPGSFYGPLWRALRPPKAAAGRRAMPAFTGAPAQPVSATAFTSPFLEGLIHEENGGFVTRLERHALPQAATNGHGLPPRSPLQLPSMLPGPGPAPGGMGGAPSLPPALLARLRDRRLPPNLPPALLARLQSEMQGGPPRLPAALPGAMPRGGFPPNVPPQLLAELQARERGAGPPLNLPPALLARLQAEMAAGRPPQAGRYRPGTTAPVPATGGTKGEPGAPARPGLPPPTRAHHGAPAPLAVDLEDFGPRSLQRWRANSEIAPDAATDAGLLIRQALTLSPASAPPALPPGTRRLSVRLAGGDAKVTVTLRSADGGEQPVTLTSGESGDAAPSAPVPAGIWSVAALSVVTRPGSGTRLAALIAETAPEPGVFGTAWQEGDRLVVRVYNLGTAAEHVAVGAPGAAPLVETELEPRGQALLRLSRAAFPSGAPPAELSIQGSRGSLTVPVR